MQLDYTQKTTHFFLVLLNHALLPVTEVWDETPYFGSLFVYVVLGESKSTYKYKGNMRVG